jgi:hypothetical protein
MMPSLNCCWNWLSSLLATPNVLFWIVKPANWTVSRAIMPEAAPSPYESENCWFEDWKEDEDALLNLLCPLVVSRERDICPAGTYRIGRLATGYP